MKVRSSGSDYKVEEQCFRVSVCLRQFFSDARCSVLVWADARRPVRWLRRRLRRLLPALPRRLALTCRGHLLPPDDPLALLRPDDAVEVIPVPPTCDWAYDEGFFPKALKSAEYEHEDDSNRTNPDKTDSHKSEIENNSQNEFIDGDIADCTLNAEVVVPGSVSDITDGINFVSKVPHEGKKTEDDILTQVKENALALLESYSIQSPLEIQTARGTKRTRRRCRRRKTHTTVTCEVNGEAMLEQCDSMSEKSQSLPFLNQKHPTEAPISGTLIPINSVEPQSPVSPRAMSAETVVIRNAVAAPRVARVVHPLTLPKENQLTTQ